MSVVHATDINFEAASAGEKVLVKFGAAWCKPCQALNPIIEDIATEDTTVKVVSVDIDESPSLAAKFNVRGVPTLVLLNNGVEVKRHVGMAPKAKIKELVG